MRMKQGPVSRGGTSTSELVYVATVLYTGGDDVIRDLRQSGFTGVVAWAIGVLANGDLWHSGQLIVKDGQYLGDPAWPGRLAGLKDRSWGGNRGETQIAGMVSDLSEGTRSPRSPTSAASECTGPFPATWSHTASQSEGGRDLSAASTHAAHQSAAASSVEGTSVSRLIFSLGGWRTGDFPRIKGLIEEQGTGPDSILHRNFKALKEAIPDIDAIDLDNEDLYDKDMTLQFCRMLHELGFEVTFCPFEVPEFWLDCLHTLNSETPGLVTNFLLQCYAGGSHNDPGLWIDAVAAKMGDTFDAAGFVYPGLWCIHGEDYRDGDSPEEMEEKFVQWKTYGVRGGFLWLYEDIQNCAKAHLPWEVDTAAYAHAIAGGLSS